MFFVTDGSIPDEDYRALLTASIRVLEGYQGGTTEAETMEPANEILIAAEGNGLAIGGDQMPKSTARVGLPLPEDYVRPSK